MISDQLKKIGIIDPLEIIYNPSFDKLYQEETLPGLKGFEEAQVTEYGAINVKTGKFGVNMDIRLINEGHKTFILQS